MTDTKKKPDSIIRRINNQASTTSLTVLESVFEQAKKDMERIATIMSEPMADLEKVAKIQKKHFDAINEAVKPFLKQTNELQKLHNALLNFSNYQHKQPTLHVYPRIEPPPRNISNHTEQENTELKHIINEFIRELRELKKPKKARSKLNKNQKVTIILNEDFILFLSDRPKKSIDFSKARVQKGILKLLNNGPMISRELAFRTGAKNTGAFYKAIRSINDKAKNTLKLKKQLIDNDERGYFISNYYNFVVR